MSALACGGVTLRSDTVFSRGSTNTEPGADRGPRAGSPRGVVVATGKRVHLKNDEFAKKPHMTKGEYLAGRYRSRF